MDTNLDRNFIAKEKECSDVRSLNSFIKKYNFYILYVNIRSLSKNIEKLQLLINRTITKPNVIICTETWTLEHTGLFNIPGYKLRYNEGNINKADSVSLYIKEDIIENTETIVIDRLNIICTDILINNNETFRISASYRLHSIKKLEYIHSMKKYIDNNKNTKNRNVKYDRWRF